MFQQSMFSSSAFTPRAHSACISDFRPPLGRSPKSMFWEELVSGNIASKIQDAALDQTIGSSGQVYNVLKPIYAQEPDVERMMGVFTSQKNKIIAIETIARGSISGAAVYPREIIKTMLRLQAANLVISHNHPSGDPTPSPEDVNITKHIVFALHCIGATLLDHIVIGSNGRHHSFADKGYLVKMRQQAVEAFSF